MANFDVDVFLKSKGASITGVNPDTGKVSFKTINSTTGKEKEGSFDPRVFLKSRGANPDDFNITLNRPETATNETGLGFLQQMDALSARTPGERFKFLQQEFGKDNVKRVENKFVVKDSDGVWKGAESTFLANLVKESPIIALGIAGSIKGAAIGLASPIPGGAVIGMIIGGGIGAAMGKITDIATAEAAGIRSESDASDALTEVGKEFVDAITWGVAFGAAGKVLKLAKRGIQTLGRPALEVVEDWAQTADQMTGAGIKTYRTLFDPDLTKRVLAKRDTMVNWIRQGRKGIDPNTKQQIGIVQNTMERAKSNSSAQFAKFENALDKQGLLQNTKVDVSNIGTRVNELRKILFDPEGPVATIVDSRSLSKLKKTFSIIERASKSSDSISLKQARTLRSNLDEMLESSGFYKQGEFAVTKPGRRIMKGLRDDLSTSMGESLKGKTVIIDGQQNSAVEVWNRMNSDYHKFRNVFDDFAIPKKLDTDRAATTVNRMLGDKGGALEEQFLPLSKLAGDTKGTVLDQLRVLQSGKNLGGVYAVGRNGIGQPIRNILTIGLTSPVRAETQLILSKVGASTINVLNKAGKAVEFLSSQKPDAFSQIITNAQLFRGVFGATNQATQQEEQLTNQLLGQ